MEEPTPFLLMREYDVVRAIRALDDNVTAGSIGTILLVYRSPRLAYEVEFMEDGQSLGFVTVEPEDIEPFAET